MKVIAFSSLSKRKLARPNKNTSKKHSKNSTELLTEAFKSLKLINDNAR
jgi:hypothetical protein